MRDAAKFGVRRPEVIEPDFAAVMFTDSPPQGEADDSVVSMDEIELQRRMMLTLPAGWRMSQLEPQQPASTYVEFKRALLTEIARCMGMPYNIAAGDSSDYNYASGRLDHQTYFKAIDVDRHLFESKILDRIFTSWLWEYTMATGARVGPSHSWFWPGREHVDPVKEASAQAKRLDSRTTTLSAEYAAQGKDWESELEQYAREQEKLKALGLTAQENPPK